MVHPYASDLYAQALSGLGEPLAAPDWGSFLLKRPIPAGGADAAGAYPLAVLPKDGGALRTGLTALRTSGLVSIVLVPDPLSGPAPEVLSEAFDLCAPFKTHLLVDPSAGAYAPSKHHRERIRRGLRRCRVEHVRLADHLDDWKQLYGGLAERRAITGPAAFPPPYFDRLTEEPRLEAFAAFVDSELVAMTLWFAYEGVVYNHLTAANVVGYANGASFALYDAALERFRGKGVVNLGGGAGFKDDPEDGLAAFKRGFANAETTAWLCGAILDAARYEELSAGAATTFFPAYRG